MKIINRRIPDRLPRDEKAEIIGYLNIIYLTHRRIYTAIAQKEILITISIDPISESLYEARMIKHVMKCI
jgi:hypothetical protein